MSSADDVLAALRRYWGYDAFRPLQQRIVASLMAGRDTCVVMPTGGGKSLCYQMPAAMSPEKTVIVVSPLIALMQDQVTQLGQMGIEAGMLNSSLPGSEQFKIARRATEGGYRLLYLSPERLAKAETIAWLKRVPVSLFAIDEAHCISEWGHEFRPDYRQLSSLREHFPECPIAAFTASATRRVRHDIIDQLRLRNPDKYIASFHRANLRYAVKECDAYSQTELLLSALRQHEGSNVIVYAPTINRVGQTVALLEARGVAAVPYHGQMESAERKRNQERWMSDEVRVLVGTIAFGLGINKASVRAVIHLALPKSIEQYYQEAGRAGRDGEPSDCVLLWQRRDVGLLAYFNDQIEDPAEKNRAWQRYTDIVGYAQSRKCRHRQICLHFGETPKWSSCGVCDVCGSAPEWLAASEDDADGPKQRKKRKAAKGAASPADRLGQSAGAPPQPAPAAGTNATMGATGTVASRPSAGRTTTATASRAASQPAGVNASRPAPPLADGNSELREYLRLWRRDVARARGLPAFAVMHDTSLEELCRYMPDSLAALRQIHGFGERKTETFGREILAAISRFRQGGASEIPQKPPRNGS